MKTTLVLKNGKGCALTEAGKITELSNVYVLKGDNHPGGVMAIKYFSELVMLRDGTEIRIGDDKLISFKGHYMSIGNEKTAEVVYNLTIQQ